MYNLHKQPKTSSINITSIAYALTGVCYTPNGIASTLFSMQIAINWHANTRKLSALPKLIGAWHQRFLLPVLQAALHRTQTYFLWNHQNCYRHDAPLLSWDWVRILEILWNWQQENFSSACHSVALFKRQGRTFFLTISTIDILFR